jgi:hypothetical protein
MVQRSTYDALALLGDIGGLNETLQVIGMILVSWFTGRNANAIMTQNLFTKSNPGYKGRRISQHESKTEIPLAKQLAVDFQNRCIIPPYSFIQQVKNICKPSQEYRRLRKIQHKGAKKIDKELDVLGIIEFRRKAKVALSLLFDQTE